MKHIRYSETLSGAAGRYGVLSGQSTMGAPVLDGLLFPNNSNARKMRVGMRQGTANVTQIDNVLPIDNCTWVDDTLVSVIIPVYNKEHFLGESLDSVLSQTYENLEVILIDDCSTDTSRDIIKLYENRDSRIRYIKLDCNSGAAAARNAGIAAATGRYIAFIDADDIWMPEKLEKQIEELSSGDKGFSFTAIEMIDEDGRVVKGKRDVKPIVSYSYLLTNTMIACSSVILDRKVTGNFRMPGVRKGQDFATWLSILKTGVNAYGIDEALVKYRLASNSISSNKVGALRRTWYIYRNVEQLSLVRSAYCFVMYALHAIKKYFF